MLLSYGIEKENIKSCAKTGLVVDIKGKGKREERTKDTIDMIALRADMDGLPIPENNPNLPYKTKTQHAHMCGHDGHMATLCCAVEVLCKHREKIPENKTIRLLFQPSEEGPDSGALVMVKEGCMEGVDEVYGYHNVPNFSEGDVRVV